MRNSSGRKDIFHLQCKSSMSLEVEKQNKMRENEKREIKKQGTLATWQQVGAQEERQLMRKSM